MSEKRFTPGPWRLGRVGSVVSDSPVEGMGGSDAIEYYGGHCVCESVVEPNAHLIAAAPDLYDALETASLWMWDPDENSVESFERINEWFMKETGYMRPGKSYPMETPPPDNLQQIWDEWRTQKSRDVLSAMRAALAKARGEA